MAKIEITPQEAFDRIVAHAAQQKCQAISTRGGCVYRGPEGRKCFVGALIPDRHYSAALEDKSVWELVVRFDLFPEYMAPFLDRMQSIHDLSAPVLWKTELAKVAEYFCLDASALESFPDLA